MMNMGTLTSVEYQFRVLELETAIRKHRDQKGDDRCHLDDNDLYAVLKDGIVADTTLPPKEEFLAHCARFYECRGLEPNPQKAVDFYKKSNPGIDHIGVCVTFYCVDSQGRFLMHKRGPECRDEVGNWDMGGGRLEMFEHPYLGVIREIKEEYGVDDVEILEALPAYSAIRKMENTNQRTHWIALPSFARINPAQVNVRETGKITEPTWFHLNDLPKPLHEGLQISLKKYADSFERWSKCLTTR